MIEFLMPSLGADMEAGILREWFKKPGDSVKRGDIIADVETQKGVIEIEVFEDGVIEKLLIRENEKVPVGTVMALISPLTEKITEETALKKEVKFPAAHRVRISPLAKKLAEENNIDLSHIKGSGEDGAITRADVEKSISDSGKEQKSSAETLRMAIAAAMSKSNREIPHYYLETKIDMSLALDWLKEKNRLLPVADRILPVALFIKVIAMALTKFPHLNATWENGLKEIQRKNIGLVINLREGGVVIPAIMDADTKNISEIMKALLDVIQRARMMKLRSSELSESSITLTNLGDNAVETVFGVIYPPQVALIGIGNIHEEPWAEKGMLNARPVVHITLSADHRATDGHTGARFLEAVKELLSHPSEL